MIRFDHDAPPPAATPDDTHHNPAVHAFAFRGHCYAYFPRTGDLTRVDASMHALLRGHEAGEGWRDLRDRLLGRFPRAVVRRALSDLSRLRRRGYLATELSLVDHDQDVQRLLAHEPRNLMFFVTDACNLACTYCYEVANDVHTKGRNLKVEQALEVIDRYLEDSPSRRQMTITFFGGEPLLNFRAIRAAVEHAERRCRERGVELGFTMTTNLTLLTEEIADFLVEHRFHVMVSIDGDRHAHDGQRVDKRGRGTYDRVVENLELLIEKSRAGGVRLPRLRATLTSTNIDPIATERHLLSLGTPHVQVGEAHGTAYARDAHEVDESAAEIAAEHVHRHVNGFLDALEGGDEEAWLSPSVARAVGEVHAEVSRAGTFESHRPNLCGVCRNMKAITAQGDVYPCHRYVGMEAFKLGNVHRGGVDQAKIARYYRGVFRSYEAKCVRCWARHLCGGQCPWSLATEDGRTAVPDESTCRGIRRGFERSLGLYAYLLETRPGLLRRIVETGSASPCRAKRGEQEPSVPTEARTNR